MKLENCKVAIIGLGYVGLPLAVAFADKYPTVGFDIDVKRIKELKKGLDRTLEVGNEELNNILIDSFEPNRSILKGLFCTSDISKISDCNVYIITVPTPVDKYNNPVLEPMKTASKMVAKIMKKGDIVIYESTVYPGVTEDEMVPILKKYSCLTYNKDFFVGYSPERINPGDKNHTVTKILKVTSGSTTESAKFIDKLYNEIIVAGTYLAPSIKVAEAAKVIENSQRDINIAFVNELSKVFNLLNIDTLEVLKAASTKWNFLPFKPGIVGGHCIGVDPYYIAQKAQEVGYHPEIILAGRRINDSMGKYIASETIKLMLRKNLKIIKSKILILGLTFKEDCPDTRNTKVIDVYKELSNFDINVEVYDPWVNPNEVRNEYSIDVLRVFPEIGEYSAIILTVAHSAFKGLDLRTSNERVVFDVKGVLDKKNVDGRL